MGMTYSLPPPKESIHFNTGRVLKMSTLRPPPELPANISVRDIIANLA